MCPDDRHFLPPDVPRAQAEAAEHELLGDILEAQAVQFTSHAAEAHDRPAAKQTAGASAVAAVAESTLRVDAARIDAKVEQGILTVRLPKSERAKPRKVTVTD